MAAHVPDPMEREREHPRLASALAIDHDHDFLINLFKVWHGFLEQELLFHPQFFLGNGASKLTLEVLERMVAAHVLPCERAAVQHILDLKSSGQISEYKHDDIQLVDGAARDAVSKHGHGLPKTTVGTIDGSKLLSIIDGSSMLTPSDFAVPSTLVTKGDLHKFAYQHYLTKVTTGSTTSGSCKFVVPELAGTSTVGSRMPPLLFANACRMPGGGSAQTGPEDPGMLLEAVDLKLDSGASYHVVCEKTLLQDYKSLVRSWYIQVADGYPLEVVGIGCIITKEFFIPNVFLVKGLKENLISVSQLARDHGLFVGFHGEICKVLKRDGEKVGGGFVQANGLYKLCFLEVPEAEAAYEGA